MTRIKTKCVHHLETMTHDREPKLLYECRPKPKGIRGNARPTQR
jgi:hypothetical protein